MPLEKQFTVKEACAELKISETSRWRLRKEEKIDFVRVRNRPMFLESHLEAFQQSLRRRTPRTPGNVRQEDGCVN